jgi:hypothetical protein
MSRAEAVQKMLKQHYADIQAKVDASLVAIIHRRRGDARPELMGTGVYVRLQNRFFILSAGHVVALIQSGMDKVSLPIATHATKFRPNIIRAERRKFIDAGYLEIHKHDANTILAKAGVFMSPKRIEVMTREQLLTQRDSFVLGGYPGANAEQPGQQRFAVGLRYFVATPPDIPNHTWLPNNDGTNVLNLGMPSENEEIESFLEGHTVMVPALRGVSGGGCWRAHAECSPWNVDLMKLVGIHVGTVPGPHGAEPARFAHEVLVGYHLRQIYDESPDLHAEILQNWPNIADDTWLDWNATNTPYPMDVA